MTRESDAVLLTLQCDYGCGGGGAQGDGVADQVVGLQGVSEGNPHQITKSQHEAKTIVHQVHGGQYGLLGTERTFVRQYNVNICYSTF